MSRTSAGDSEGDIRYWGTAEGRDGYDAIEELAKLPWSNGKIGLAGNSWLAMSQYYIAAEEPPHLAAIAPLEGLADGFREESFRGGIPLDDICGLDRHDLAWYVYMSSHSKHR